MSGDLKSWQHSMIRKNMEHFRRSQEDYCLLGKPTVKLDNGQEAFSLIAPPMGSPIARRRIRLLMDSMVKSKCVPGSSAFPLPAHRTPHVLTLAVNYDCQCSCAHCSAASYQQKVKQSHSALTLEELQSVVSQSIDLGTTCVIFTGGEPLLFKGIAELVGSVDKSRAVCTLFTNGEYMDRETALQLKQAGLFGVFVSFDHADPARHDENRGRPGLFKKACQALKTAREAGLLTGVSTFATKESIRNGDLDAMMDLARNLDVLELFLFDVIPAGKLADQRDCMLSEEDVEVVREFRRKYSVKPEYPRIIHQTMFASLTYPCVAEGCPAGIVHMHVRANGDVTPCDFTPHSFGNLRESTLGEIWDRMTASRLYATPSTRCRLSTSEFWARLRELETVRVR